MPGLIAFWDYVTGSTTPFNSPVRNTPIIWRPYSRNARQRGFLDSGVKLESSSWLPVCGGVFETARQGWRTVVCGAGLAVDLGTKSKTGTVSIHAGWPPGWNMPGNTARGQ